ncbi:MAG: glycoside hydrolase family 13 protein [Clostridia bacterium]|nr:glycoside hydrolase family 13 protein [Clostridia bacterium]
MAHQQDKIREYKYILQDNTDVSLFGALRGGSVCRVELHVPKSYNAQSAVMRIHSDGYEGDVRQLAYSLELAQERDGVNVFSVVIDTDELTAELVDCKYGLFYYEYVVAVGEYELHLGGEHPTDLDDAWTHGERQLMVYDEDATSSDKMKGGIIYHIFVDRFKNSGRCPVKEGAILDPDWDGGIPQYGEYPGADVANNVFFGGDLWGIAEKLPYIAKLGASTIYLSPVFDAASNHKYDTADYLTVDSMFGGDDALRHLCAEAEKYGISIMLDGVFNHTGSDSLYFNKEGKYDTVGAYQSEESPYYDWYCFKEYPDKYDSWWGVQILPRVDSSNDGYIDFICDEVIEKWMDAGVSHWRLDVADELSDKFLSSLEEKVHSKSRDAQIIGEVWEDASDKVSYGARRHYLSSGQLSSVMNYPLRNAIIAYINQKDVLSLRYATETLYRRYPKHVSDTLMNFLGTHDTERAITVFGDDSYRELTNAELSVRRMAPKDKAAAAKKLVEAYAIICALPGVPCVFYGDEAGLEGYRDPFCRMPFPWNNMDEEISAAYRELGMIRKSEALLRDAYFRIVELNEERFIFERTAVDGSETLTAVINNTEGEIPYTFDGVKRDVHGESHDGSVTLPPRGWVYLKS